MIEHAVLKLAPRALALVLDPFAQFAFAGSALWWPNLVAATATAAFAFCRRHDGLAALGEFRRRYLGRALWAHPSAEADYACYIVNALTYSVLAAPLVVSGTAIAAAVAHGLCHVFGPPRAPLFGTALGRAVYTLAFFVAYDFARYLGHVLMHEAPVLWRFHRLHHSAEVLTPLTAYRVHPVELVVMGTVVHVVTGLMSGVFSFAMVGHIDYWRIFGLHVALAGVNLVADLRHFPVRVSFGRTLDRWLISPAHHHLHHSRAPQHAGVNRGFMLAIWDRFFGTLLPPGNEAALAFGLGDGTDGTWRGLFRLYGWPCRDALRLAVPRFWRDRSGNYSMVVALLLPVILGFVAMGSEAGFWFYTHETMQAAADEAAFSAARVAISGGQWSAEALGVASAQGFANGVNATSVAALSPPEAGAFSGDAGYYEVFISQVQPRLFSAVLLATPVTISARAVAAVSTNGADGCLVALDKSAIGAISASGGASLNLAGCDLYDDSAATGTNTRAALVLTGGAGITATAGYIVGTADATGLDFHGALYTGAQALADPFANLSAPSPSGCGGGTRLSFSGGNTNTLNPGTYCDGISISGGAEIDLNPGIYVLDQGTLSMSGGSSLWCPPKADWTSTTPPTAPAADGGCTIVLTSSTLGSNDASCAGLSISGGSVINLNAPSSGPTRGFAFMSAQGCVVGKTATLTGGSTQNITGTIYLPSYSVSYSGGATTGGTTCVQLIADTISFTGGSGLGNNCNNHAGQYRSFGNTAALVE